VCSTKHEFTSHVLHSVGASSLRKHLSSASVSTARNCLVVLLRSWTPAATSAARENIATAPKSGKAHAGAELRSFLDLSSARARKISLASYFRPTTDCAQGSEGVVLAGGVVVTVLATSAQQAALSHSPSLQTVSPFFKENPSGHVKLAQVGAGVVVTVVQGAGFSIQHIALSQEPSAQTTVLSLPFQPSGHVKSAQVDIGVVVTVVVIGRQHVDLSHSPLVHTTFIFFFENPPGQVKSEHMGTGVVVTVVIVTLQHVALSHSPLGHTMSSSFLVNPSGQVKL